MTGEPSLRIAVVGHTNTGKTSLLQTLLRRRDFGVVSPRGGTTRASLAGEVADSQGPIATILDTPGLEDSLELRERLEAGRADRHEDPRTLLDRLLESPVAASDGPLGLEADAIRSAIGADVLLYAIDAREEPRPRHVDELAVLAATARPLVPLLNFTARPEARADRWRETCARQGLHATVAFDAVVYDDAGERRLLEAIRTLAPDHADAIDRWLDLRAHERAAAVDRATEVAADLLVDAAAATVVTERADDEDARRRAFEVASGDLLESTRRRESHSGGSPDRLGGRLRRDSAFECTACATSCMPRRGPRAACSWTGSAPSPSAPPPRPPSARTCITHALRMHRACIRRA